MARLNLIAEGNHNNLHGLIKIGSRKDPLCTVKVVLFTDKATAFITTTSFSKYDKKYLNMPIILREVENALSAHDYKLMLRSENDLLLPSITTEELLNL